MSEVPLCGSGERRWGAIPVVLLLVVEAEQLLRGQQRLRPAETFI